MAGGGDHVHAAELFAHAEAAPHRLRHRRAGTRLDALARQVFSANDHGHATELLDRAHVIAVAALPRERDSALFSVTLAAADHGDLDRAERFARSITNPDEQARTLMSLVEKPDRRRVSILTRVLRLARWILAAPVLIEMRPSAFAVITDELNTLSKTEGMRQHLR